ncbi:MAG TPA: 3-deoxy-manno-octulosonate cytidylyltransferase [Gemmatimonadaceae bacterium]|nr:3-deoxy-manno-octulosonate cytidylyltransferase [Gemmatimonadaceae bacterium]
MSTLVVIPARLGASRLPRKPLRLLGGAPLVVRVWERVMDLGIADRCVIATDSPEVASAASAARAECALTAHDHPSGTDRVAEVAARPEYARYRVIVNVQGDEPFVSEAMVRGAAEIVERGRAPLGTAAAPATREHLADPNIVKVVCDDDGRAMYFSRSPIPRLRDDADGALLSTVMRRHVGIYAYTPDALARWVALPEHSLERIERLEQLRPLAAGIAMGVATVDEAPPIGIDTEADLERANAQWAHLNAGR